MVRENLLGLGRIFPELYIDTAMVMPNHVHVVLKIESRREERPDVFHRAIQVVYDQSVSQAGEGGRMRRSRLAALGRQLLRQPGE